MEKYGFQQLNNRYASIGMDGKMTYWSNFVLRPLFHIRDTQNAIRIYEMENIFGKKVVRFKDILHGVQQYEQVLDERGINHSRWAKSHKNSENIRKHL